MTTNVIEKTKGSYHNFLSKVAVPIPQNETRLNNTTHAISVIFLPYFLLAGQSISSNNCLVEIILSKINRWGVGAGIRMSRVD